MFDKHVDFFDSDVLYLVHSELCSVETLQLEMISNRGLFGNLKCCRVANIRQRCLATYCQSLTSNEIVIKQKSSIRSAEEAQKASEILEVQHPIDSNRVPDWIFQFTFSSSVCRCTSLLTHIVEHLQIALLRIFRYFSWLGASLVEILYKVLYAFEILAYRLLANSLPSHLAVCSSISLS